MKKRPPESESPREPGAPRAPEPAVAAPAEGEVSAAAIEGVAPEVERLEQLESENRRLAARLLEAAADLDNQAKRMRREMGLQRDAVTRDLASQMIEVLDNLERALEAVPEPDRGSPIVRGVTMVRELFLAELAALGIEPVEALLKPFDPFQHEAVAEQERADVAPGTVIAEIGRGYRMGAQLVRAARVMVAKASAGEATAP
jgi:molecular chaperone GrpE